MNGEILRTVGRKNLIDLSSDYLDLLDTSAAVYEKNGDCALGLFCSGWCRFLNEASRSLCGTDDNAVALASGRWLCHESCWTDASKRSIETGEPVDVQCNGGLRLFAVPIRADADIVGSVNFGYGDPPKDTATLRALAAKFQVSVRDLEIEAASYEPRPAWLVEMARRRLVTSSRLLGEIVERTRREAQLRAAEEMFRTFFEHAPVGKSMTAPDGRLLRVNPAFCHLLGYSSDELGHLSFQAITHPDDLNASIDATQELAAGVRDHWTTEKRYVAKDGHVVWAYVTTRMVRGTSGEPLYLITHVIDISDRKATEAALQVSREKLRVAQNVAGVGTFEWDIQANESRWSPEIEALYGLAQGAFGGRYEDWAALVHPDDLARAEQAVTTALTTGTLEDEWRVIWPDGSIHWLQSRAVVLKDDEGHPDRMIGANFDITNRKAAEDNIRSLNAELEQRVRDRTAQLEATNRELEAFAYSVSHDLRTPLRGISGWSQVLLEDYGEKLDQAGHECLNRVCAETNRMGQLIDDLLALSRVTRSDFDYEPVDLTAIANAVIGSLAGSDATRHVEVVIGPGLRAIGDARLMRVVLENLLGNAWKFTSSCPAGRIQFGEIGDVARFRTQMQPVAAPAQLFFVSDNGVGFDMAFAAKLFAPFQRLHKTSEFPGSGIGLATVQRVIRRHGGTVWADSSPQHGATFYFAVPARR